VESARDNKPFSPDVHGLTKRRFCGDFFRPRRLARALVLVSTFSASGLTQPSPSALPPEDLITSTQAALKALTALEAGAVADREAFAHSEADLQQAMAAYRKALPKRPLPLDKIALAERKYVREQLDIAAVFHKAWEQRKSAYEQAARTLKGLKELSISLRPDLEQLFDHISTVRQLLIEAQRRIDRRDVKIEAFELEEGSRSISEWIAESAKLASRQDKVHRRH